MMSDEQVIDEKKFHAMTFKILKLEKDNQKTREKAREKMIEKIRRIIIDEVKKNY